MRRIKALIGISALAMFASGAFFTASAGSIAPNAESTIVVTPWKDAACDSDTFKSFKIDDPANGVYGPIKIKNLDSDSFDWKFTDSGSSKYDIAAVIVKGGPDSSVVYIYGDNTDDSDTNLQAAWNDNSDKPYGVSHITFCFDKKG